MDANMITYDYPIPEDNARWGKFKGPITELVTANPGASIDFDITLETEKRVHNSIYRAAKALRIEDFVIRRVNEDEILKLRIWKIK